MSVTLIERSASAPRINSTKPNDRRSRIVWCVEDYGGRRSVDLTDNYLVKQRAAVVAGDAVCAIMGGPCTIPIEHGGRSFNVMTLPAYQPGEGSRFMLLTLEPCKAEIKARRMGTGAHLTLIREELRSLGFDPNDFVFSSVLKHPSPVKKPKPLKTWIEWSRPFLTEEIKRFSPEVIITFGAKAYHALTGSSAAFTAHRAQPIDWYGQMVWPMGDPKAIIYKPENRDVISLDLDRLYAYTTGSLDTDPVQKEYHYVTTNTEWAYWCMALAQYDTYAIDCEWGGGDDPKTNILRTIQICFAPGKVVVLVLARERGECTGLQPRSTLKPLLERGGVTVIGHFLRADLLQLSGHGIDVSKFKHEDTALMGHTLNETWPQNLETYALRFTNMGRYDRGIKEWIRKVGKTEVEAHGFLNVPDDILHPYAASDADCTFRLYRCLNKLLRNNAFQKLYTRTIMPATLPLLEMEETGMPLDLKRLREIATVYSTKECDLRDKLRGLLNWPEFNPASGDQKKAALFNWKKPVDGGLKRIAPIDANVKTFTPIYRTTDKKPWSLLKGKEVLASAPSADKQTLLTLAVEHPDNELVETMLHFSLVNTAIKTFTGRIHDDASWIGGLKEKVWADGRTHTRISQILKTGRYGHYSPNMANLPKAAEGLLLDVIEGVPPIRSAFKAPLGWVFMDADWKSAELFNLAAESNDSAMMEILLDEDRNLHVETCIDLFDLDPVPSDWSDGPKAWIEHLGQKAETFYVLGKTVTFGVPYGRGALAIALMLRSYGVKVSVEQVQLTINKWKQKYHKVAAWMEKQKELVRNQRYVTNSYGRRRHFPISDSKQVQASQERQGINQPIQGNVGDMMSVALANLYRLRGKLNFKLVLTVHDQIVALVPINEIIETRDVFRCAMVDKCVVPGLGLRIPIDPSVSIRWGQSLTENEIAKL